MRRRQRPLPEHSVGYEGRYGYIEEENHMYYQTEYSSPLGEIVIASDEDNIIGLWFTGQKYFWDFGDAKGTEKVKREGMTEAKPDHLPVPLEKAIRWLDQYFQGKNPKQDHLPLSPMGGEFRQTVWSILCEIPAGTVTTYGKIAKEVARRTGRKSMSAQAVGGAVGHNPISIIIPCHRVVGSDGSLTGYAGGIDKKIALLKLEGVEAGKLLPKRREK